MGYFDSPEIRGIQKAFLIAFNAAHDRDDGLAAAGISDDVYMNWLTRDPEFFNMVMQVVRSPKNAKIVWDNTPYQDCAAKPAKHAIVPTPATVKESENLFSNIGRISPREDSAFSNPTALYQSIKGSTDEDLYKRQAIFLDVFEWEGQGVINRTCRMLGMNKGTVHKWTHDNYCATRCPEIKEVMARYGTPEGMGEWRSIPVFKRAIESLEREHAQAPGAQAPNAQRPDEEAIWKDAYKNASDIPLRQVAFLLMLEKAGGNINEAARRLDTTPSTSEKWKATSEEFRMADREIRAGMTDEWKTREPYAGAMAKLEVADGAAPQFMSDQQKTFAGRVNGAGKKILETHSRREWAELVTQMQDRTRG